MNVQQLTELVGSGGTITMSNKTALMLAKIAIAANNHEIAKKDFARTRAGCVSILGIDRGLECAQYKTADKNLYDAEEALTEALIVAKVDGLFVTPEEKI
jgi:hypothetical protein